MGGQTNPKAYEEGESGDTYSGGVGGGGGEVRCKAYRKGGRS